MLEKVVINMGSYLSSLSSTPPPPPDDLMEMKPFSRSSGPRTGRFDQHPGRRYPLNPNGHFTTNLLTGFKRRTNTQTQQEWVLEPLLISADHSPNGCQSGDIDEVNITV